MIHTDTNAAAAADSMKPLTNLHCLHARKRNAIGSAICGRNKPAPIKMPAKNSLSRSSITNDPDASVRNRTESCPCNSANATGKKAGNSAAGSQRNTAARLFSHGRSMTYVRANSAKFSPKNVQYAVLYRKKDNAANTSSTYAGWLIGKGCESSCGDTTESSNFFSAGKL